VEDIRPNPNPGCSYLTDDFDPGNDSEYFGEDSEFADNDVGLNVIEITEQYSLQ